MSSSEPLKRGHVFFRSDLDGEGPILVQAARALVGQTDMSDEDLAKVIAFEEELTPISADLGHGVGLMRVTELDIAPAHALVECPAGTKASDGEDLIFTWVVFGDEPTDDVLEPFGWMMLDDHFGPQALTARTGTALREVYERYIDKVVDPKPEHETPVELRRVGGFGKGIVADIRRRLPHYGNDFCAGFHPKSLASVLFLFFACLAPAVAFGGLLSDLTDGQMGAMEMIVATALCGTIYALISGQPLTILGSTGPVIVFVGILFELCESFEVDFFMAYAWVGLWTMVILVVLAFTEASSLVRFFTRFTDETFAGLIAIIFIVEALKNSFKGFFDGVTAYDTALLSLLLAFGTYSLANQLARFRSSPYLVRGARDFLADFGPAIAICAMTAVAFWLHPVDLEKLAVPAEVQTTTGRAWFVNPLNAPGWVVGAAIGPALMMSVLLFLDQNITVRLINAPENKLKKGAGYHLDLLIVGVLVGVCSLFGLPWMVAATVRSLNHVRSLATTERHGGKEVITSVRENRLTGLLVHVMVGSSLLLLTYIGEVPMSVLFGLFLFMGVGSMRGNQLFERMRLWFMDPAQYPPTHFVRRVPRRVMHTFTVIQTACLAVLWFVKTSFIGILFPLFIALLVPVRFMIGKYFDETHLRFLDAEEEPKEEHDAMLD
ncbi:MAG: hypothetical protein ACI9KE_004538 [Polyangiales bacterium]|jgi:hypothetical protein